MATRQLQLYCSACGAFVLEYKKAGTGNLVRLYLDRIGKKQSPVRGKSDPPLLHCPQCAALLGRPARHEGQPVYKVIAGALRKKPLPR